MWFPRQSGATVYKIANIKTPAFLSLHLSTMYIASSYTYILHESHSQITKYFPKTSIFFISAIGVSLETPQAPPIKTIQDNIGSPYHVHMLKLFGCQIT